MYGRIIKSKSENNVQKYYFSEVKVCEYYLSKGLKIFDIKCKKLDIN